MILQAHIDESEDNEFLVLAGYVSSTEHWAQFADEWDAVLAEEPRVPYLKTKEAMARPPRGAFEGLTTEQSHLKLERLYEVIERHVFFEVSCTVFLEPMRRIVGEGAPYYYAVPALIEGVVRRQIAQGMTEKIDFIFDERMESKKLLQYWTETAEAALPDEVLAMLGSTPIFRADTGPGGLRPLQAADLNAWWWRRGWRSQWLREPRVDYPWRPTREFAAAAPIIDEERFVRILERQRDLKFLIEHGVFGQREV